MTFRGRFDHFDTRWKDFKGNRKVKEHETLAINLKRRFPFRLGTTSYIVPADLLANVEFLAGKVDDIELVLFESDEISNIPDDGVVQTIRNIAEENDHTYTVHLPLDIQLGSSDEAERSKSVDRCLRVIARISPADPFAYVIHFHGDRRGDSPSKDISLWQTNLEKSIEELLESGVAPRDLCVETLDYSYKLIEKLVFDYDLSICLDIGHIFLNAHSLDAYLDRYIEQCRAIHLHGISDGKDHRYISDKESDHLSILFSRICSNKAEARVVTLEVFNEKDLIRSVAALERFMR